MGKGTLLVPAAHGRRPPAPADPAGVELFGPSRADRFLDGSFTVGFTHSYSCSSPAGSTERSNLFESHRVEPVGYLTKVTSDLPAGVLDSTILPILAVALGADEAVHRYG